MRGGDALRKAAFPVLCAAFAFGHSPAWASIPLTLPADFGQAGGVVVRWDLAALPGGAVPYSINPDQPAGAKPVGPPGTTTDQVEATVRAAFQAWEDVPTARIRYQFLGRTTRSNGLDGSNVVTFSPQGFEFPPQFPGGVFPLCFYAPQAGAVRLPDGSTLQASFPGQVLDCDLVVNPQGNFTVEDALPPQDTFDLQGSLIHEIGHFSGLDHTGIAPAVMYGFFTFSGGHFHRQLKQDDRLGLSSLYPEPSFLTQTGAIGGTVTMAGGAAVFGAHLVAIEPETGRVVGSAASGLSAVLSDGTPRAFSSSSGEYQIRGLPPGDYQVLVEPLDGPGLPFLSGVFGSGSNGESFIKTDFLPRLEGSGLQVTAGAVSNLALEVSARPPLAPNLTAYSFGAEAGQDFVAPAMVKRGIGSSLAIGLGENLAAGGALVTGASFRVSGSGISFGSATVSEASIFLPITVSADAAPGPRLLIARTPQGESFLSGGVTVLGPEAPLKSFHRGDPDASGLTDLSDAIFTLNFLFLGGPLPGCSESADFDNDGHLDVSDGVSLLNFLFLGGPPPASPGLPGETCGPDPDPVGSPRDLGCDSYDPCPA